MGVEQPPHHHGYVCGHTLLLSSPWLAGEEDSGSNTGLEKRAREKTISAQISHKLLCPINHSNVV